MCGIFGVIGYNCGANPRVGVYKQIATNLLMTSQCRGTDASGICVTTTDYISVFKDHDPGRRLVNRLELKSAIDRASCGRFRSIIGHTRHKTKGTERLNVNNHPITAGRVIGVHNGMINNDDYLFEKFTGKIERAGQVDSEIIFRLIDYYLRQGNSVIKAVQWACTHLAGSYHCAFIDKDNSRYVTLFHNSGKCSPSLMLYIFANMNTMIFASEEYILETSLVGQHPFTHEPTNKYKVEAGGIRIDTETGGMVFFNPIIEKSIVTEPITGVSARQRSWGQCLDGDCDHCAQRTYCFPES